MPALRSDAYTDDYGCANLYKLLEHLGAELDPKSYLEVGVLAGGSFAALLRGATRLHSVVLCDTWGYVDADREKALALAVARGVSAVVLNGSSHDKLPEYFAQPEHQTKFDLALIDGDHSADGCRQDMEDVWPYARVMVVDDIFHTSHPYLIDVVEEFAEKHGCLVKINKSHNGAAVLLRKQKVPRAA